MPISRRTLLAAAFSPVLAGVPGAVRAQPAVLRLSHPFPGGTLAQGDFRDRLARRFAADLAAQSQGALRCEVVAEASLAAPAALLAALADGRLAFALVPLADAAGEIPALAIAAMPGLVDDPARDAAVGEAVGGAVTALLAARGVVMLCAIWQGLGLAVRPRLVGVPDDARGLRLRGGGPAADAMLRDAGAVPAVLPAAEIYAALEGGRLDGALLPPVDINGQRLAEVAANITAPSPCFGRALTGLLMSRRVFDGLAAPLQAVLRTAGAGQADFAADQVAAEAAQLAQRSLAAGAPVQPVTAEGAAAWLKLARQAQAAYARQSAECAGLLALAGR